ncbi:MAG: response regulator [Prolixibacteraceae bacterium]|jgi:osomolarity two-component system sensor histidine kinase NIK1|nr:response regulator [Prolixibacteraceae bacterium]MDI9562907.1 response regulator [Bacteroidota bacterium]NLS99842.1 response regulator [Bacteroidales bacterium]OQB80204.1 MAG: Transcriptional regulatory protein AfsQ1 [Bacteroidetes bacterium ADurb.Bin123]HNU78230.1 response regulator [Prolixibacteraceae bacterium]
MLPLFLFLILYFLKMIKSRKILVIEDNLLNQKILFFLLRKKHEIKICSSGECALQLFKSEWFDIVLMDLMLPGIDGYETAGRLRVMEKKLYGKRKMIIIALTANTLDNDRDRCLASGMNDYLPKPFNMQKFNDILASLNFS